MGRLLWRLQKERILWPASTSIQVKWEPLFQRIVLVFGASQYRNTAFRVRAEIKSCASHTVLGESPQESLGEGVSSPLDCGRVHSWNKGRRQGLGTSNRVQWEKNARIFLVSSLARLVRLWVVWVPPMLTTPCQEGCSLRWEVSWMGFCFRTWEVQRTLPVVLKEPIYSWDPGRTKDASWDQGLWQERTPQRANQVKSLSFPYFWFLWAVPDPKGAIKRWGQGEGKDKELDRWHISCALLNPTPGQPRGMRSEAVSLLYDHNFNLSSTKWLPSWKSSEIYRMWNAHEW